MPKSSKMHIHAGKLRTDGALAYTDCISCPDLGTTCNADNLATLDGESFRAWCILRMEHLGWSHSKTAEVADVPKGTFDNWISGITKELRWDTAYRISRALCGISPTNGATCPLKSQEINDLRAKADAHDLLQSRFDRRLADDRVKIDHLKAQNEFLTQQIREKDAINKEYMSFFRRKNTVMAILGVLLGVCVALIITALVMDAMNPNIGFFWLNR